MRAPLVIQQVHAYGDSAVSAGLSDLIEYNSGGFLVPKSSPRSIAEKACEPYENEELCTKTAAKRSEMAKELLIWTITIDKIKRLLRERALHDGQCMDGFVGCERQRV